MCGKLGKSDEDGDMGETFIGGDDQGISSVTAELETSLNAPEVEEKTLDKLTEMGEADESLKLIL